MLKVSDVMWNDLGVSAGLFGGARAIQDFLPVIRELGLVNIFETSISGTSPAFLTIRERWLTKRLLNAPINSWMRIAVKAGASRRVDSYRIRPSLFIVIGWPGKTAFLCVRCKKAKSQ